MVTITWKDGEKTNCNKCGEPICTYQPITITVKGEFTVMSETPFIQDGTPIIKHKECPEENHD